MLPPGIEEALLDSATFFVQLSIVIFPLFILASFLVGLAQEYLSTDRIEQALENQSEGSGNVAAATLGAVTPFCSCSGIPIAAGLLQSGAPVGIVLSFLIASPLINEIAIPLLFGLFGWKVTLLYVVITFSSAVVAGLVLGRVGLDEHVKDSELFESVSSGQLAADGGMTSTASTSLPHKIRIRRAGSQAFRFFKDILPYALFGLAIAALIHGAVPVNWLQALLGPQNPVAVPMAVLAGVPLYLDLTAMLPIAAALVSKGIPIGTVLALLVGVVGVSLPELIILNKLFNRRLLAVYVGTTVLIGIAVGVLFNGLPL